MSSIRCLNRLTALYLNHQSARSDISNLGLAELAQMSSLRRLELRTNCSVTALGMTVFNGKAEQSISAHKLHHLDGWPRHPILATLRVPTFLTGSQKALPH